MYGYVYLTTNLVNGKKYIGKHKSESFDTNYIGSGKILVEAIKKYGKENFSCEILCECESLEELNLKEKEFILNANAIKDPSYYNLRDGGDGGAVPGRVISDETRKHISEALIGHVVSDETKQKISENSYWNSHEIWNKGIPASEESKAKNRAWHLGRKQSPEAIEKHRLAFIGHEVSADTRKKISNRLINIPKSNIAKENMAKARIGKKLISNEETKLSFYVELELVDLYLNEGFHLGRLNKQE